MGDLCKLSAKLGDLSLKLGNGAAAWRRFSRAAALRGAHPVSQRSFRNGELQCNFFQRHAMRKNQPHGLFPKFWRLRFQLLHKFSH
jgi:hypothetical protein